MHWSNLISSTRKVYSLKRGREDKDKDKDPPAGLDQGLKKSNMSKESAQAEKPVFETTDTEMPQDQGDDMGNTEDQPNVEEASKHDWFKKLKRPPTPDHDWNARKQIDFRPPQTWISKMAKARKPPTTFDELMSTLIEFSAYDGTDKLDWTNPEGHEYPFYLIKPLPLIKDQGRQVVPANYFFNNDLEYLKGRSLSSKYTASTTKTKAAKYDTTEGIEDMVPSLWSLVKVAYDKYAM
ncbi:hypothetical protein Tco_0880339 [Tanacetum coccineum]